MSLKEAITLSDDNVPYVKIHPIAIMGILNSYDRRTSKQERVIGTLLGFINEGCIEVTDCFGVPHMEKFDDLYVAINQDYHKSMLNFHQLVNRREKIIGWYTTTISDGSVIIDNSSLIHEFYSDQCNDPVHIVMDTTLAGDTMGIRAFFSEPMLVGDHPVANMFSEVKVEIAMTDAEITCLHHMINGQENPWESTYVVANISNDAANLRVSMEKLVALVDKASAYVDQVIDGSKTPIPSVGIAFADLLGSLQSVRNQDFSRVFHGKAQDLLMVSYLSTLIQSQLAIAERLQAIV